MAPGSRAKALVLLEAEEAVSPMPLTPDRKRRGARRGAHRPRQDTVRMVHKPRNSGHPGGPLGMADFMAVLFLEHLNLTPANRLAPDRDRFVLGNGHTCAGYYSLLVAEGGSSRARS
jgi:transketolase